MVEDLTLNIIDNETKEVVAKYRMNTADGIRWTCDLRREAEVGTALCYYYSVERNGSERITNGLWSLIGLRFPLSRE